MDVKSAYDKARATIPELLRAGNDVIFDATNARLDARVGMINIGRQLASRVICIWLDTPFAECLARHEKRLVEMQARGANIGRYVNQVEPLEVAIRKQCQSIAADPPKLSDGFDQIIKIVPF
jgi:predicted kinase